MSKATPKIPMEAFIEKFKRARNAGTPIFAITCFDPAPTKGDGAGFNIRTTAFNDVPMFMAKSGSYEVTAVPQKGGFVEGTFKAVCENVKNDGTTETFTFTGKFRLPRR